MAENKYYGMYQGIVTNNKDPEKRGRIKVKCPDVLGGGTESAWCDPVVTVAYDRGGDFCIPAKEETVWIQFIAGDSNRPVYLGGWWGKNKTPLGENYSDIDDVRIINYADCTITLKNGTININVGSGVCDLKIEPDNVTVVGNLKVTGSINSDSLTTGNIEAKDLSVQNITSQDVNAQAVSVSSLTSSGKVKGNILESTSSVKGKSISSDSANITGAIKVGSVEASGDVKSGSISLTDHVHENVTTGSDDTGKAK